MKRRRRAKFAFSLRFDLALVFTQLNRDVGVFSTRGYHKEQHRVALESLRFLERKIDICH